MFKCFDASSGIVGDVGSPNPTWFQGPGGAAKKFTQLDFVWSLMRARRADETIILTPTSAASVQLKT